MSRNRLADRDAVAFWFSGFCALAGVLIWTLWVLPVAASVGEADAVPLGRSVQVELPAGDRLGIWGSGISAAFGTMTCTVTDPSGGVLPLRPGPSLSWDDTLWWMTPQRGFEQTRQFTTVDEGVHAVTCSDALDTYGGEFLVAGDAFGSGSIGLGRSGSSDFAVGTLLAFGAVVCPLIVLMLPGVILIRRLITRRRRTRDARAANGSWTGSLDG